MIKEKIYHQIGLVETSFYLLCDNSNEHPHVSFSHVTYLIIMRLIVKGSSNNNKVKVQTTPLKFWIRFLFKLLWRKTFQTLFFFFLLDVNFENITIGLHVLYILNTYVKFCSNWMLFIIQSINIFLIYNILPQKLEI